MKKNTLIYLIALAVIAIILSAFFFFGGKNEIRDTNEISKIVSDSNLELLLNLGNFTSKNYSDEKLLQVAMLLASKDGYMNESTTNDYFEYVTKADLHEIIHELTGITVEAPIEIEDFYYQYDSENEFYYLRPAVPPLYEITNINRIYSKDNIYTIETTATKTEDGEIISQETITTKLKPIENSSYTNYQVIEQKIK